MVLGDALWDLQDVKKPWHETTSVARCSARFRHLALLHSLRSLYPTFTPTPSHHNDITASWSLTSDELWMVLHKSLYSYSFQAISNWHISNRSNHGHSDQEHSRIQFDIEPPVWKGTAFFGRGTIPLLHSSVWSRHLASIRMCAREQEAYTYLGKYQYNLLEMVELRNDILDDFGWDITQFVSNTVIEFVLGSMLTLHGY